MDLSNLLSVKKAQISKRMQCGKCIYFDRPFIPFQIEDSEIAIVGKMPSSPDVEKHQIFADKGGELLRKVLNEVGFDDQKISYLNTLCCNSQIDPPNNKAVKECSDRFLLPELKRLSPKLILLAGNTALRIFFPKKNIMSARGKVLTARGMSFLPIIHPTYCLKHPSKIDLFKRDLNKAFILVRGYPEGAKNYVFIDSLEKIEKYTEILKKEDVLAVDAETNNTVDVYDPKIKLWTNAFGTDELQVCIPLEHPESPENVIFRDRAKMMNAELLAHNNAKIFHNANFDVKLLRKKGYVINGFIHDTMILAHLLDENRTSYKLKDLADELLEGCLFSMVPVLSTLYKYNCEDVENTFKLYLLFMKELKKSPDLLKLYKEITAPMSLVAIDLETNGVKIDLKYCNILRETLKETIQDILDSIKKEHPQTKGVNLDSTPQLSKLFFDVLGYEPVIITDKGNRSVNVDVLEKLSNDGCKLADKIMQLRTTQKLLSTYVEKLPDKLHTDNRLRARFNIIGTRTGRLSSSSPNLQNIPKSKVIKKMFIPRRGYVLLNADASQAELRVACSISKEKNMIKAYNNGIDIHSLTASRLVNVPVEEVKKEDRQKAKGVNFGFLYGSTAEGFAAYAEKEYGLVLTVKQSKVFRDAYFSLYPGFVKWHESIPKILRETGQVVYPTGRIARFPAVRGLYEVPHKIIRQGINYPVQGSSSDIVCQTMVILRNFLKEKKIDAYMVMTVHDSIVFDCLEIDVPLIQEEMDRIAREDIPAFHRWLRVPWLYEYEMGKSWGEVK